MALRGAVDCRCEDELFPLFAAVTTGVLVFEDADDRGSLFRPDVKAGVLAGVFPFFAVAGVELNENANSASFNCLSLYRKCVSVVHQLLLWHSPSPGAALALSPFFFTIYACY